MRVQTPSFGRQFLFNDFRRKQIRQPNGQALACLNPFAVLNKAIAKVPQLKYALAVMGSRQWLRDCAYVIADPKIGSLESSSR